MRRSIHAALALGFALLVAGCGGSDQYAGPVDRPTEEEQVGGTLTIAGETANDHGKQDVSGEASIELELNDFSFEPTLLIGEPGQTLTLQAVNKGDVDHTFTILDQAINEGFLTGTEKQIEITFPESGEILFVCKFHEAQGMRGGLSVAGG